jgi:hypothetical protein
MTEPQTAVQEAMRARRVIDTDSGWGLIELVDAWHGGHRSPSIPVLAVRGTTLTEHGYSYICGCIFYGDDVQTTCDIVSHSIFPRAQAEEILIGLADQYLLRSRARPSPAV